MVDAADNHEILRVSPAQAVGQAVVTEAAIVFGAVILVVVGASWICNVNRGRALR